MTKKEKQERLKNNQGRLAQHRPVTVWISFIILVLVFLCVILSFFIEKSALEQNIASGALPPLTEGHLLGTDALGRDVLALTIAGARSAIIGPIVISVGSILTGVLLGSLAGWFGGAIDWIISRYTDLTLSLPSLLLAIVVAGIIGGGYWVSVVVLMVLYSPFDIRLVRSAVIAERNKPYIESAIMLKLSSMRILFRHILPNIIPVVSVNFFLNIGYGIVSMSSLSYLGLGVSPQSADWGRQLLDGRELMFSNPAAVLTAGIAIILTATAINIIGSRVAEQNFMQVN